LVAGVPDAATVEIHLFAAARAAVGESVVTVQPGTLGSVLDELGTRFPAFVAVRPRCSFLLNEVSCTDSVTAINAGSRLDVLPPFAGG
jgi:molybdopterin converting factor small subunit